MIKGSLDFVKKLLEINEIKLNEQQTYKEEDLLTIEKRRTDMIIKKFINKIDKSISEREFNNRTLHNEIDITTTKITENYKNIEINQQMVEKLVVFRSNLVLKFEEQLEELKKLKFIKKVSIDDEGILLDMGNLTLTDKNIKVFIGRMIVLIQENSVKVYNEYSMNSLQHPHIWSNTCCFGTYAPGVSKLLAELDLKRLAFVIYQFLNTYTHDRTYSGGKLINWKEFRIKENKFDEDGNPIVKVKEVKKIKVEEVKEVKTEDVIVEQNNSIIIPEVVPKGSNTVWH